MESESIKQKLLERVILNMNYISSLTCEENKKLISEVIPKFDLTTRKTNLDTLSPEKLIELGKKWGWKQPNNAVYSQPEYLQKSSQVAKSYLLSIGYPKFGPPPGTKSLENNPYYIEKTKKNTGPKFKTELGKTKIDNIEGRPEFGLCLSKIQNDFSVLPPEALEAYSNFKDYCKFNSEEYKEKKPLDTAELDRVMENYRNILLSDAMIGVQLALAASKYGYVVDSMLWGVLVLYDEFKYTTTNNIAYAANMILDMLSILTGGVIGKSCKTLFNTTKSVGKELFEKILQTSAGKKFIEIGKKIISGSVSVVDVLKKAKDFMLERFKLKNAESWLKGALQKFSELVVSLKQNLAVLSKKYSGGRLVAKIAKKILSYPWVTEITQKIPTFDISLLNSLKTKSAEKFAEELGTTISKSEWSAVISLAEKYFRDKPTEELLKKIDEEYGTNLALIFVYALSSFKLQKSKSQTRDNVKAALTLDTTSGKKQEYYQKGYDAAQQYASNQ